MRITINDYQMDFESLISSCIHETNAETKADTLTLKLSDPNHEMHKLGINQNDVIRIDNKAISTGDMFIHRCQSDGDIYEIRAMSIPVSGTSKKSESWQRVHLMHILKQKADEMGFELSCFGVDNVVYNFVSQDNETNMSFLLKLCERESYQIIVFNRHLIVYSEPVFESKTPSSTITIYDSDNYKYADQSYKMISTCNVSGGQYSASFRDASVQSTNELNMIETYVESDSQALRYAKSYLRSANKNARCGSFTSQLDGAYAAGSVVYLSKDGMADKKVILTKVRYDYKNESMKVFFRDIFLEGY